MNCTLNNNIATLTIDDGKANVVGHEFLDTLNAALDRAEAEKAGAVILVELTASRISRRHMTRAALLSEVYSPDQAVDAGFIDEVVNADELDARTQAVAKQLAQLPAAQFAANKLSVRARTLRAMKESLEQLAKR